MKPTYRQLLKETYRISNGIENLSLTDYEHLCNAVQGIQGPPDGDLSLQAAYDLVTIQNDHDTTWETFDTEVEGDFIIIVIGHDDDGDIWTHDHLVFFEGDKSKDYRNYDKMIEMISDVTGEQGYYVDSYTPT